MLFKQLSLRMRFSPNENYTKRGDIILKSYFNNIFISIAAVSLPFFVVFYTFGNLLTDLSLIPIYTQQVYIHTKTDSRLIENDIHPVLDFEVYPNYIEQNCKHRLDIRRWAIRAKHSPTICFAPGDKFIPKYIQKEGNWEIENQRKLFKEIFPLYPEAAFLDLGANSGVYSLSAAILGRKVLAFEPMSSSIKSLLHTIAKNHLRNQIMVFPYALMDNSSSCVSSELTAGKFNFGATKMIKDENCANREGIKVTTLDAILPILEILNIKQVIIKMDMEGSEARAIFGGQQLLKQIDVPVIFMEFHNIAAVLSSQNLEEKKVDQT